jgi:hypothetical protein
LLTKYRWELYREHGGVVAVQDARQEKVTALPGKLLQSLLVYEYYSMLEVRVCPAATLRHLWRVYSTITKPNETGNME